MNVLALDSFGNVTQIKKLLYDICIAPEYNHFHQGDQKTGKKSPKFWKKKSKTVANPKKAKISSPKLNLKVQNIYIKPLLPI